MVSILFLIYLENNFLDKQFSIQFSTLTHLHFLDTLRYIFTPGARLGSKLLYTLDEKQLYCREKIHETFDRYVCKIPQCRSAINVSKPDLKARRGNSTPHRHPNQEDTYLKNRFEANMKTACVESNGLVDPNAIYIAQAEM